MRNMVEEEKDLIGNEFWFGVAMLAGLTVLFYKEDVEQSEIDNEEEPTFPNRLADISGVLDNKDVSDTYVPGKTPEELTMNTWFDSVDGIKDGDNKTISWRQKQGTISFSGNAWSPHMLFDWALGFGHREITPGKAQDALMDRQLLTRMNKEQATELLYDNTILRFSDMWSIISTPCSSTKLRVSNAEECMATRRGVAILAYRFFSSKEAPIYPQRPFRVKLENQGEVDLLGEDPRKPGFTRKRYFLGAVDLLDQLNPALIGSKIDDDSKK